MESGVIKGCNVKNLELLQDFTLINNIFCDKTGTLTKNILVFKKFSFKNTIYEYEDDM